MPDAVATIGVQEDSSLNAGIASVLMKIGGIGKAFLGLAAAAAGPAVAIGLIGKAMEGAARRQTLSQSFITLLGNADAARSRIAELANLARQSGGALELPAVVHASERLQLLTHGALASGAAFREIADAALTTHAPIDELASHIGILYANLMSGRPLNEGIRELMRLGVISQETRAKLEGMQAAGMKGAAVWAVAEKDISRFSGQLSRQANTWEGIMGRIGAAKNIFKGWGEPMIQALSPFMARFAAWLEGVQRWVSSIGPKVAGWVALIAQAFADGQLPDVLGKVFKIAALEGSKTLLGGLVGAGRALIAILGGGVAAVVSLLSRAGSLDFWKGMYDALRSAAFGFLAIISEGVGQVFDAMRNIPGIGDRAGREADSAHAAAGRLMEQSEKSADSAGNNLAGLLSDLKNDMESALKAAASGWKEGYAQGSGLIDTSGLYDELKRAIAPIAAAADKAVKAAAAAASRGGLPQPIGAGGAGTAEEQGKKAVASIQRIGGGGGWDLSRPDPALAEARRQTAATQSVVSEIRGLRSDLRDRGQFVPAFG